MQVSWKVLELSKLFPASGPLHFLFPLPETLFPPPFLPIFKTQESECPHQEKYLNTIASLKRNKQTNMTQLKSYTQSNSYTTLQYQIKKIKLHVVDFSTFLNC